MDQEERLHEMDLQRIQGLCIFDDEFLKVVFDGCPEATELVLNVIFDRTDMKVIKVLGQREIKGIEGHSVKLDIMAEDSENHVYDIEVQRQDTGNLPQRARYNSSLMDTVLLPSGADYSKLVPTYVIFFTEKDAVGDGWPLHKFLMRDEQTGALLGDERHIIFVNGNNSDEDTQLGKLVHDFKCTSPNNMYYDVLAKRVSHFKNTEGGVAQMSKMLDDMRKEAAVQAVIKVLRGMQLSEDSIIKKVTEEFNLTEDEAKSYMLQESA